jgi:hypothetical protein
LYALAAWWRTKLRRATIRRWINDLPRKKQQQQWPRATNVPCVRCLQPWYRYHATISFIDGFEREGINQPDHVLWPLLIRGGTNP